MTVQLETDTVYGCLKVVGPTNKKQNNSYLWRFECIHCKTIHERRPGAVTNGRWNSCWCRFEALRASEIDHTREADMVARWKADETLASIAEDYGITEERVRQIIKRTGTEEDNRRRWRRLSRRKYRSLALTTRGNRTVLGIFSHKEHKNVFLRCRCKCGKVRDIRAAMFQQGHHDSCGSCALRLAIKPTYGDWTVLDEPIYSKSGTMVPVRCKCGTEKFVALGNLVKGLSKGCHPCGMKRREERKRCRTAPGRIG